MKAHRITGNLLVGILCFGVLFFCMTPLKAGAQTQDEPVAGIAYNVDASMFDNLKALSGKKVHITLRSGTTFTGTVGNVSTGFVHLEKLEGKEYFDALISLADISALDTRFRMPKR